MEKRTQQQKTVPQGTRQVVWGFEVTSEGGDGSRHLLLAAQEAFLPLGLFVSGVTDQTTIGRIRVSNQGQDNGSPIPALWFQTRKSFAELDALAKAGEIVVPDSSFFQMDALEPGCHLRFEARGPIASACAWGLVYDRGARLKQRLSVTKQPDGSHLGKAVRHGLRGEEVLLEVTAPTELGASTLLQNWRQHGFYG